MNGPSIIWDTHKDNTKRLRDVLVPPMEQAYAALLDDLSERGLLETTLVVWMGEFGRTPKINADAGAIIGRVVTPSPRRWRHPRRAGRGSLRCDRSLPVERAVSPADIHATVFAALGYDNRSSPTNRSTTVPSRSRKGPRSGNCLANRGNIPADSGITSVAGIVAPFSRSERKRR